MGRQWALPAISLLFPHLLAPREVVAELRLKSTFEVRPGVVALSLCQLLAGTSGTCPLGGSGVTQASLVHAKGIQPAFHLPCREKHPHGNHIWGLS